MDSFKHNRSLIPCGVSASRHGFSMASVLAAVLLLSAVSPGSGVGAQRSVRDQITEAVSPLKSRLRDDATVLGYSGRDVIVLREGTNHMVCLADNPRDNRFQVSCYHKSLEPFMARGRELRVQGLRGRERQRIRNEEIESGKIVMPPRASVISLYGIGEINQRTGWPDSVATLEVLYLPFATAEETGFPDRPSRTSVYLMDAGTARAHLMIPGERLKFRPHDPMRRR